MRKRCGCGTDKNTSDNFEAFAFELLQEANKENRNIVIVHINGDYEGQAERVYQIIKKGTLIATITSGTKSINDIEWHTEPLF